MDSKQFDNWVRSQSDRPNATRRSVLKRIAAVTSASVLGAVGLRASDVEAACRNNGAICREHANCCSGYCNPNGPQGRKVCGNCPVDTTFCSNSGTCRDLSSDPANCGACGASCPSGSSCEEGACTCSYSAGGLELEEGEAVSAICDNGVLTVEYSTADGGDLSTQELEDMDFEELEADADASYLEDDTTGPEATIVVSSKMCVARSSTYDNLPTSNPLLMTRFEIYLAWKFDGFRIRNIGKHSIYSQHLKDGWERVDWAVFLYQKTMGGGYWVQQGIEGWVEFHWINPITFRTHYRHTHHVIMYVDRYGGCRARDDFDGTLPGKGNNRHKFEVFTKPYQAS